MRLAHHAQSTVYWYARWGVQLPAKLVHEWSQYFRNFGDMTLYDVKQQALVGLNSLDMRTWACYTSYDAVRHKINRMV